MYGRKTSRYLSIKKNVLLVTAGSSKAVTPNKSPWTQEEKNTFLRGMGIFGRSWSKIAGLIPTRTSLQVKNYAQQYMKNLAKKKAEIERNELETLKCMTETPLFTPTQTPSLQTTIASVTTGQPTIPVASSSGTSSKTVLENPSAVSKKQTSSPSKTVSGSKTPKKSNKPLKSNILSPKVPIKRAGKGKKLPKRSSKDLCNGKPSHDETTHTVIAYSDVSETAAGANQEADLITVGNSRARSNQVIMNNPSKAYESSLDKSTVKNESGKEKISHGSDEDDIDVEIDIENDDEENLVLQSRSTSPSSVYQLLLKSADIDKSEKRRSKTDVDSLSASTNSKIKTNEVTQEESLGAGQDEAVENNSIKSKEVDSQIPSRSLSPEETAQSLKEEEDEEEEENHHVKTETIVNGLIAASGEIIEFEIPSQEKFLDSTIISEEEKKVHADFFDGRAPKTPERYLKIRNYIIDCWVRSKPSYLNKTSIRAGLKNCGDVNCIGRIHSYLECIGAINFGCELAAYKNPNKLFGGGTNSRVKGLNKELISSVTVKSESTRPRKRRIRDGTGLWVDEKELEGKTIDHNTEKKKADTNKKPKTPRAVKPVYDPFKLVPCLPFSDENAAPYEIEMFSTALAIMDIHAHISKTEVIGMLGGHFCAETHRLTVSMAVPCKSMSTGMQCEMDPVSQTLASEQIEDVGMQVVGWYHSHPTFSPDPSVRDIETQQKFQYWFSKGGNHFVGVIISPYNTMNPSVNSDIRCLTISDLHSKEFLCNIPYKFAYEIAYRDNLREILGPASELAEKYSNYVNRVMLSCQYRASLGITCLSKMLQSVKRLLVPEDQENSLPLEAHPSSKSVTACATVVRSTSAEMLKPLLSKLQNGSVANESTGLGHQSTSYENGEKNEPLIKTTSPSSVLSMPHAPSSLNSTVDPGITQTTCLTIDTLAFQETEISTPNPILPSGSKKLSATATVPSSSISKSKVDEVLHWLEQIFLEKFSQGTPRSPPIGSLSSLERAKPRSPQSSLYNAH
ncbi:histone H2A deubiquitinase MYSM1-like [Elysia marginata]|uniref:Myb-like, SWIRM and MPN domain-containing protein 1 n=1 Tax=Elysia marginata TaxID=1093978 RepID=A0AAV4G9X1_9GAST|nr:histone H2A deubiquitinase MYSM1-like [Elysia marginata]